MNMSKKICSFLLIALLISNAGCKKFIDVNTDPNNPVDVQEALILAPIELNFASVMSAGGFASIIINHWMQNVALNQPVPNQGTYQLFNQDMSGTWSNLYVTTLSNLKSLTEKAEAGNNPNYAAVSKILTAFTLGIATDYFGDIPYSEALKGSSNFQPAYDSQESIYSKIQELLDGAIADINQNSATKPKNDDYYYKGDMNKWKRLAYTLKARYYMHLIKAPGKTAAGQADLALTALANGLSANSDDMVFTYPGSAGQQNPTYVAMLPVSTLIVSSAAVDTLVNRSDPRLPFLIAPAKSTGLYNGRPIGSVNISGSLDVYSLFGPAIGSAASPVTVFSYAEALFLKAEATLYKSGFAAAEPIYQDAIKTNMQKLGVAAGDITTYLGARGTLTAGNALRLIMEEKKIANFLSIENFNDWRRTGFPALDKVPNALSEIPRRMLYPQSEILSNPQAIHSAKLTDRIWWDQ